MEVYDEFKFENKMLEIELKNGEKNVYYSRGWDGYALVAIEKVEAVTIFSAGSCIAIYPFNAIAKLEVKPDLTALAENIGPNGGLMSESGVVGIVKPYRGVTCIQCKYAVRTKDGELNPKDIVCSMWGSDGFDASDFCSRGEEGNYEADEN